MHKFKKGDKVIRTGGFADEHGFMKKGNTYIVNDVNHLGLISVVGNTRVVYYDAEQFELVEEPVVEESVLKHMKFRVNSPEHSKQIQKHLFTLGYKWKLETHAVVEKTNEPFLYAGEDGWIMYGTSEDYFKKSTYKEYTLQEIKSYALVGKKETITIDGKEYYKEDVLKRLAELNSLN